MNYGKMLTIFSIVLALIGTTLLAYEIMNPFGGDQFRNDKEMTVDQADTWKAPEETNEYKIWLKSRRLVSSIGLILIFIVAVLQIISLWYPRIDA